MQISFDLTQANGPEVTLSILLEAYPYVLDVPDGTQRLVDEHNRRVQQLSKGHSELISTILLPVDKQAQRVPSST